MLSELLGLGELFELLAETPQGQFPLPNDRHRPFVADANPHGHKLELFITGSQKRKNMKSHQLRWFLEKKQNDRYVCAYADMDRDTR